ncbi:GL19577 [Drosophila persimilis]|uniref:Lactosylceramide 4-alpha-galactosyltransferase-like n=2 Tax=pseudoobscura subgroup TaxID=32358 RepID=A0A6I8UK94_DROPS|nr:lactosylceramide 4-alpha-galactosyltransferase [Drosophila pseudoobscura]XP_002015199.1 lactosylceramide 4-alpha-galactosyltransferase [Drosophila persimilis]EDW29195.1 GL19577 [Drosophila persimilis]
MLLRLPLLLVARYLHNGRLRLLFVALIVMLIGGIALTYNWQNDLQQCFMDIEEAIQSTVSNADADPLAPIRLEDVLQAEPRPTPGRSIFFHETSCHQAENKKYKLLELTARQACAIESAALHNPNFQVFVLFAGPTYRPSPKGRNNSNQQPLVDAILSYSNVHLRNLNLWRYAAGTPIEEWLKDGSLFRSRYLFSHISDFLRYLTLYRYGGLYLDMDVVVLQKMEDVPPNYTGAESNTHLAAGVMSLAATGFGHEIAESCLRDFQHNFAGKDWGNNGPGVITRVAQQICGTKDITLMQEDSKRCLGFKVYGRGAFYAVPWKQWRDFFEPEKLEETMGRTKDSYVVHVWNKHSNQLPIKVGSNNAYAKYAEQNCPRAYRAAGEYF